MVVVLQHRRVPHWLYSSYSIEGIEKVGAERKFFFDKFRVDSSRHSLFCIVSRSLCSMERRALHGIVLPKRHEADFNRFDREEFQISVMTHRMDSDNDGHLSSWLIRNVVFFSCFSRSKQQQQQQAGLCHPNGPTHNCPIYRKVNQWNFKSIVPTTAFVGHSSFAKQLANSIYLFICTCLLWCFSTLWFPSGRIGRCPSFGQSIGNSSISPRTSHLSSHRIDTFTRQVKPFLLFFPVRTSPGFFCPHLVRTTCSWCSVTCWNAAIWASSVQPHRR